MSKAWKIFLAIGCAYGSVKATMIVFDIDPLLSLFVGGATGLFTLDVAVEAAGYEEKD